MKVGIKLQQISIKKWAKTYHTVSDIERYTNIHKLVIGKDVELKPGKVFFSRLSKPGFIES